MKLIVIDTSGPVCGVAVMDEDRVYSEFTAENRHTHSEILMPMTEMALEAAGTELAELDAVAAVTGPGAFEGIICPIRDARAGQVYCAAFQDGKRLTENAPLKLEEFLQQISPFGSRCLFTGDGVPVYREKIQAILGEQASFSPPYLCYLRPSAAGQLALESGNMTDYLGLQATYLRPPNAVKNRKLLEAMQDG